MPDASGLFQSTCRYSAQSPATDAQQTLRITELARECCRFGYRHIWQLLRLEGLYDNHRQVNRSYHFNGCFRDEYLNVHGFSAIAHGRNIISNWRLDYTECRPYSAPNDQTPSEFAYSGEMGNQAPTEQI